MHSYLEDGVWAAMTEHLKGRVLLVDDEPVLQNLISGYLVSAGYVVQTAVDGLDSLGKLRAKLPDLTISDLNMPRMPGLEFLEVVSKRCPQIPVMVISDEAPEEMPGGVQLNSNIIRQRPQPTQCRPEVLNGIGQTSPKQIDYLGSPPGHKTERVTEEQSMPRPRDPSPTGITGRAYAGSQRQIQTYVNERTSELSHAVAAALQPGNLDESAIHWSRLW